VRARRLDDVPGFGIDKVAAAAGQDPDVLRLENLDIDIPPPPGVIEATREALGKDEYNSYLPFSGRADLKEAVSDHVERRSGVRYDPASEIVITSGEGDNLLDVLLATTDPGDEVILTDPTYAGMIYRVRLVGAVPRFVPHLVDGGFWRLDLNAL
jgi:aspartate/methionine/tyrosine aminotransferase